MIDKISLDDLSGYTYCLVIVPVCFLFTTTAARFVIVIKAEMASVSGTITKKMQLGSVVVFRVVVDVVFARWLAISTVLFRFGRRKNLVQGWLQRNLVPQTVAV